MSELDVKRIYNSDLRYKLSEISRINEKEFLKVEFKMDRFNSISIINIYGNVTVKFNINQTNTEFKFELPIKACPINNSGDITLRVDIPLTNELKHEAIDNKGMTFSIYVDHHSPVYILALKMTEDKRNDFQVIQIPENNADAYVCAYNTYGNSISNIEIDDNIKSLFATSLMNKNKQMGEISEGFNQISELIKKCNYEAGIIALRTFIMNRLTKLDKEKQQGKQRVIKPNIVNLLLRNYDGHEYEKLNDVITNKANEIINSNLEILHIYVKEDKKKIISNPNPKIIIYIYNNLKNFVDLIEFDNNSEFIPE